MTNAHERHTALRTLGLKLDLTRGQPGDDNFDLSNPMLTMVDDKSVVTSSGVSIRNYPGGVAGLQEARELLAPLLGVLPEEVLVGNNSSLAPYSARTRCRARNGQTSNGDLPGQGGADGPGCALAGTDQDASARRADLSAQQARPSGAAQLGRSRRQAVVVLYSAKHGQRDQLAAPLWRCDQLRVRLRYRMQRL